jgi:hippurate hydrolase
MNLEYDYKELHQIPEIGFKEYKTSKYVLSRLSKLKCQIYQIGETGIIAFFDFNKEKTIAFRAELDGLNIKEENDFTYKSIHDGYMHACGHDGHMSILLSLCDHLNENECNVNVCAIFQPSEEIYGGALMVVENEIFKSLNIKEIYGLHLWPKLKEGFVYSKSGPILASSTEIDIKIVGKSAHMANQNDGVDALMVSGILLNKINKIKDVVFNCGKITSVGGRNSVCANVVLECSMRSFTITKKYYFLEMLNRVAKEISEEYKVNIYINTDKSLPIVLNDYGLFIKNSSLINEVVEPFYHAEDFSVYSSCAKTLFFLIGIGDKESLHSSKFNFDLKVLQKGLDLYKNILSTC